jgi:hypothetical protein
MRGASLKLIEKSLPVWLLFGVVGILFGALREKLLVARVGELRAHQIGTLAVCFVIAALNEWDDKAP